MPAPDTLAPVPVTAEWTVVLDGNQSDDTVLQHDDLDALHVGIAASGDPAGSYFLQPVARGGETVIPAGTRVLARAAGVGGRTVNVHLQPKTAA